MQLVYQIMENGLQPLTTTSDWTDALEASANSPVLIFKHSSACSVSAQAHEEVEQVAAETDLPVYKVVVQEARSVSDTIESDLDIRHESPQIILLDGEEPVFHTSHFEVTADTIKDELQQRSRPAT